MTIKKLKILITLGNYFPIPSANGVCMEKIANEFKNRNHDIYFLSYNTKTSNCIKEINGIKHLFVKEPFYNKVRRGGISRFKTVILNIFSKLNLFFHFFSYPLKSYSLINRTKKQISKIIKEESIDMIISTFSPFESTVAVSKFKESADPFTIFYSLDSLTPSSSVKNIKDKYKLKSGIKWENKMIEKFDLTIMMNFNKNERLLKKKKVFYSDIPMLISHDKKQFEINTNNNWIYTGNLNRKNRNPSYACKIYNDLQQDDTKFLLFTTGDCHDILTRFNKLNRDIINEKAIPKDDIDKIVHESGVLISIGNFNSRLVPSKIFEYISTGKKIIHFYYNEKDSSIKYLSKYKRALLICMNGDYKLNLIKVRDFLTQNIFLDFNDLNNIFEENNPKYTVDLIMREYDRD